MNQPNGAHSASPQFSTNMSWEQTPPFIAKPAVQFVMLPLLSNLILASSSMRVVS